LSKSALISVSDKTAIVDFAKVLANHNYNIIATGNTAKLLSSNGIKLQEVKDLTGYPEIFEGRVKTLHPKINGGILMRRDNSVDLEEAKEHEIFPIDIVCVNLYPFKEVSKKINVSLDEIIENIDIGGPSLIRAAAKNYRFVSVITNPNQYQSFIDELNADSISIETRKQLAVEAFSITADYDINIANVLEKQLDLPENCFRINFPKVKTLRYGENPHQKAEVFGEFYEYFKSLHGKELSYNNIQDLISAVELVEDLGENSCAIIKHNNPAGAAIGIDAFDAYIKSLKCDPVSSFGGIVAFTSAVNAKLAEKLNEIFLEVVCAPKFTDDALAILKKKKNRRIVKQQKSIFGEQYYFRSIPGGVLKQNFDNYELIIEELNFVTDKKPNKEELDDLQFAWKIAKHTKSNAIVFTKDRATLGVGAGQMSRIDSVKIAKMKAAEHNLDLNGSIAASDAFLPFADGLVEIVKCGATSVIQPGGSVRDQEVIDAANQNKISMVFTGIRHFKH
jgi:phosphoribosylaminoimidazolecarboxamide formyltransferase/IMP cyclohydrolase